MIAGIALALLVSLLPLIAWATLRHVLAAHDAQLAAECREVWAMPALPKCAPPIVAEPEPEPDIWTIIMDDIRRMNQ